MKPTFDQWILISALGASIGSFISMLSWRLPIMINRSIEREIAKYQGSLWSDPDRFDLFVPRAQCVHCRTTIPFYFNIPVLGYFLARGRCNRCDARISFRYVLIEVGTLLLTCSLTAHFGLVPQLIPALLLGWGLMALAVIDLEHMLLPDELTQPLLWVGLCIALTGYGIVNLSAAVLGAFIGYISLYLPYCAYRFLRNVEGLGQGDIKLMAVLGAFLGPSVVPDLIFASAICGLLLFLLWYLAGWRGRTMPFGPCIGAAGILILFFPHLENFA